MMLVHVKKGQERFWKQLKILSENDFTWTTAEDGGGKRVTGAPQVEAAKPWSATASKMMMQTG